MTAGLPGDKPGSPPAWGDWYRRLIPNATHGQAVMSGPDGQPLLLLDRVGEGRTALLLSDQIWLWSRDHEGGGPQAELLRRVAHWLMKEPALEEEALTATVDGGTLSVERRTTADTPPPAVTATSPAGQQSILTLKATAPGGPPGRWRRQILASGASRTERGRPSRRQAVSIRWRSRICGRPLPMSATSPGPQVEAFIGWTRTAHLRFARSRPDRIAAGASWVGLRRNHDHLVTGVDAIPLLPAWAALPLLVGLAFAAWRREGIS